MPPYPVFDAALRAGNLGLALNMARERGAVTLKDALRIVELLALADDERYDRAAAKWFGRLTLEGRGVDRATQDEASAALAVLPDRPEAMRVLDAIAERCC